MAASVLVARAMSSLATDVTKALNDTGQSLTEAMGGFWQGVNEDPKYVPLDEFISDQFLKDMEQGKLDMSDLVLEGEFNETQA